MSDRNISYRTAQIERYYSVHRTRWDQFYPSERAVLERLALSASTRTLDVGCGCGGLGLALREHFGVTDYTGIEINEQAAATAAQLNPQARFFAADVLSLTSADVAEETFDLVVSLSCIDWNVEFDRMLDKAWRYVKPGGYFVSSFRLVPGAGTADIARSFQYIDFDGQMEGETAPYVVLGARHLMARLDVLGPAGIRGYGYWGAPSATAVTPFERVCFAVLAVQKRCAADALPYRELDLPAEILAVL